MLINPPWKSQPPVVAAISRRHLPIAVVLPSAGAVAIKATRLAEPFAIATGSNVNVATGLLGLGAGASAQTTDVFRLHSAANQTNTVWERPSAQVTVLAYFVRTGNAAGNAPIFGNSSPGTSPYTAWGLMDSAGTGTLMMEAAPGGAYTSITSSVGITNNKPTIAIGVYDGAAMRLYQNGVQVASVSASGALAYANSATDRGPGLGNFWLYTASNRAFVGRIFLAALWDRALTPSEVADLSANPWALFERRSIWVPVSAPASGGTGTLSTTLDALTSSATGSLAISGSASVTLGTLTASATGTLAITGTAGVTLDALTSAATGVHDTIAGSASITLDALTSSATGALAISGTLSQTLAALTVSAYENAPAPTPAASSPTPAGRANKRRYVVEIDGETFDVASPTEAVAVLEQARETAKEQAAQAMQRAAKAQKRPVRKVIADARKALPIPQITVPETLKPAAQVVLEQIQTMYAQTMRDIEVAARMAHEQRIRDLEDDDEDVLLLL